ncbi:MAG: hypothetical protein V4724_35900, partial [Pseudomonadota bacterium]
MKNPRQIAGGFSILKRVPHENPNQRQNLGSDPWGLTPAFALDLKAGKTRTKKNPTRSLVGFFY